MIALAGIAIQDKIYESANSLVYRGIADDGLAIVIKMLKQDYPSPQELTRYRQEYQIARSLDLEGVVKAYSQRDCQRTLVMLLEDFGGESLDRWMHKRPETFYPMPLAAFLRLAIDLTGILGRIHANNVIHKDINPGNIVLNPDTGVVKIIDFGIATQFSRTNPTFKSPHVLEGTLAYLSPEQTGRMNRSIDYRTDFYSLGVTFYQLLTGHLPFPTTDLLELVHCHIAKPPVPPHQVNAAIPKPVSEIVLKLMAKNAEDRYQSAWGIKADLEYGDRQLAESGRIDRFQLALQDVADRFQIPQKLYGRDKEVALLLAAFDRVARPADDNSETRFKVEMMLVSGYAGIGKSALVQELYKPITAKRGYFIVGKFDQFGRNIPYSAIADALKKLVQQLLGEPEDRVQQWKSRLLAALGSNGQIVIDIIPEIESIVGKQPPVASVGATEAQNRFHRVFGQFLRVFCAKEHPLTIFLDDLQWIDSATLNLIELMLLDEQAQSLFLIGAYRDNEVTPTHPLVLTLESLRKQGAVIQEIVLSPLAIEPLSQWIAEMLHQNTDTVRSLAELVLRKTDGNPFFVNEFLRLLYDKNLLTFDAKHLRWQWNIDRIQTQNITDNVVELMLLQLKKLPDSTQQVLRLAACIGSEFNLDTLSIVCERSPQTVFLDLQVAIQAGLIQPLSELDEDLLIQEYKFSHDRIQQAAYVSIDESQKQVVHLQIGRNLLEKTLTERRSERVFEIIDHLNHGIELVIDRLERNEIAKLNLIAGQKAKAAIAYSLSQKYLATSREWLSTSKWQTDYELTLELYSETTEVAYLCGDFERIECWVEIVVREAKTVLDRVKVYEVKIQTYIAQNQLLQAIDTALQVLQQLGISFPKTPNQSDIHLELDTIASLLREKPIEDSIDLPEMTEPDKLAAMRILSSITIAAQIVAPNLVPLLVSKQVNLSMQYGNAFASPFAYATFGLVLFEMPEIGESSYKFGQLALNLLSRPHTHALRARTIYIVNNYVAPWKEHIRETSKRLLEAYQTGLETGDLEFAAYSAYTYCFQSFRVGKELIEIEREMTIYGEAIRQIKQGAVLTWIKICHQTVLNLMGHSVHPSRLSGESYNRENGTPQSKIGEDVITMISLDELFLSYLFYEYTQAVENSILAESHLSKGRGTLLVPFYYLYSSLTWIATYPESSVSKQQKILDKVSLSQGKMKQWADDAPMNYLHKYHLVEAEKARVLGQWLEAEEFYERAIQGARDNEYLQEEALAYELAAKFYLERGREKFAQTYMKEAHYCYERWGATAKVKDLETRYPQLFPQSSNVVSTPVRTTAGTTANTTHVSLDLATVMKASQAISSEIELERLLSSLMQILIENAGAQTGYLLLENSGEWKIEAAFKLNEGEEVYETQVLRSIPIINHLPESIVQYVIRTHESIVLNDATREGNFTNDPYIQRDRTRSLLCLPLLNQSQFVGVLYLENQLATGAFTPDRTQVLKLLSTQAAIAIENAKLYSKLRTSESQMTQFLEAIPVGIGIIDANGRPYYANQRGIQLMGKGIDPAVISEQIAEVYQLYVTGTDRIYATENMPIIRALSGECTTVDDVDIRQHNATIPIEVWGTPIFDEQGNVVYAIAAFQDITERKQAEHLLANYNRTLEQQVVERTAALQKSEATLRDREQQLRLIADALPALIAYVDVNRCYQFINRTYEVWFSRSCDDILGNSVRELLGETAYQKIEPFIDRVFAGQTVTMEAEIPFELGKRSISSTLIPDLDRHDRVRGFYSLITDISDRKLAEAASILEERNRMAREIHDTLAQSFTGILLQNGAAMQILADDLEATQAHLETIDELARSGLAEARRSVKALRPQLLEEGNLDSALHRLITQMRATADTVLAYEIKGIAYPLPAEVENNLLRIGQEALTNAIKHANAGEIRVELAYENPQCSLQIKDDGIGFGVGSIPAVGGFGLLGISERADRIGAQLTIHSQPGQGTEITIVVNRAGTS